MDLRIERTKRSIKNAFLELRAQKPLNKITVKELSERAFINKATFYSHYNDIYDLADQLENEVINNILTSIPYQKNMIEQPKYAVETIAKAFLSQNELIHVLFSENQFSTLAGKIEKQIKHNINTIYSEYKNNLEWEILLTILIQGCFYAFLSYSKDVDTQHLIDIIGKINERMLSSFPTDTPQTYTQSTDSGN